MLREYYVDVVKYFVVYIIYNDNKFTISYDGVNSFYGALSGLLKGQI